MISERSLIELFSAAGFDRSEEIALTLLAKFHTIDGAMSADPAVLIELIGERAAVLLKLSAALASRRVYDSFKFGERHTDAETKELFLALFRGCSVETLYLLSIDAEDAVISCDLMSEGTINATSVLPRQLLERAVKNRAARVIIAHNHPAGITVPSGEDIAFTSTVRSVLSVVGIELSAHYIVAGSECESVN